MKIYETLDRDPRTIPLANSGQARIDAEKDLRAELETFVCDGQYGEAVERILASYLRCFDRGRQDSAWVSGFFGSGKSHLLKMLCHLWANTGFKDGASARSLVTGLPADAVAHLKEIDGLASRAKFRPFAAAGTLPAENADFVRLTVLSVILRACQLPNAYPQAMFYFWLRRKGYLDRVKVAVEAAGRSFQAELGDLYVSGPIAKALIEVDPAFARDEKGARQVLRDQFPRRMSDISTEEFIAAIREALAPGGGELPPTMILLDETQQYIGDSGDRATFITEIAEILQTQCDSRVLLVASGQSALTGTPTLQKLQGRFIIKVHLSDTDVEAVTRKVLLRKKPSAVDPLKAVLARNSGEISKHLQGTKLAERSEDSRTIVEDYPLLPTRRRFWEACLRAVDTPGTHSQLRSQLRILHDALRSAADRPLGAAIPSDVLFDAIAADMLSSGVLLNELGNRIQALADGSDRGKLRRRVACLVFLINRLPRQGTADLGLRANAKTVADLLIDDIEADSGPFRREVAEALEGLAADSTLLRIGDEFRLQTTEGSEWERAFREREGALKQQTVEQENKRNELLKHAIQKVVNDIRLKHGRSKLPRGLVLHARDEAPAAVSDDLCVWLRTGWSTSQKEVEAEARRRGLEDPVLCAFVPKKSEGLKDRIVEAMAASAVLESKGVPSSNEGKEAREGMQSRLKSAESARDELLRDVVEATKVFTGGAAEVYGDSLRQKLETAAQASLARLFPRFPEGDHDAWGAALNRIKESNDQALSLVGWDKPSGDHPVIKEVLARVGNGAKGNEIRKTLMAPPFGWPKDAVDAALAELLRAGAIKATLNGSPFLARHWDHAKAGTAEFRPERVQLGTADKLSLRGLFGKFGIQTKSGEEEAKAVVFFETARTLATAAGGDAPAPARPSTNHLEDLARLSGSEQLGAILAAKTELEAQFDAWAARKSGIEARLPAWRDLERLLHQASGLPVAANVRTEVEAVRTRRALLDNPDPAPPLRAKLAAALRARLTSLSEDFSAAHQHATASLAADASWNKLEPAARTDILRYVALAEPKTPAMATDADLLRELDAQPLDSRIAALAAVHSRTTSALVEAAKRLVPAARHVALRKATLRTPEEVRAWLTEQEAALLTAVEQGPVVVG